MSSRADGHAPRRGRGGGGGFKPGGNRLSSQKHRGVSLDGFLPAESNAAFVNGQFRESGADHIKKRKKKGLSRKEQRKKDKEERKTRVKEHELRKQARKLGVDADEFIAKNSNDKKRKREDMEDEHEDLVPEYQSSDEESTQAPIKRAKSRAEEMDDKIIREMEKKLGMDGSKKKKFDDGLDSLFDFARSDDDDSGDYKSEESSDEDSEQEILPRKKMNAKDIFGKGWKGDGETSRRSNGGDESDEEEDSDDFEKFEENGEYDSEEHSDSQSGDEDESKDDSELNNSEREDEDGDESEGDEEESLLDSASDFGLGEDDGSTDSEDDGSMFGSGNPYIKFDADSEDEEDDKSEHESDEQENPKINAKTATSSSASAEVAPSSKPGMYIPPALRARMAAASAGEDSQKAQMIRELRGHVNRLSDANIESIFEMIESMFSKYPRKVMTDELVRILVDDCIASVGGAVVFTFAPTYAAITMMLHLTIGAEIGGAVIQGCARELQTRLEANDLPVSRNLLLMFINFYNYHIVHCSIVYDIIRLLIRHMNEQNVDLLLLLIQKCGMSLRKDDASAIKEIISSVNEVTLEWKSIWESRDQSKDESGENDFKISGAKENTPSHRGKFTKRVQFMIESLNDVKNNKAVSKESDSTTTKMKNAIEKYFKKRFGKKSPPTPEPLRISWQDLIGSDHLGRWWVVGSATQIPSDQRAEVRKQEQLKKAMKEAKISSASKDGAPSVEDLARSQQMTSATRKAIFSIIVTSEDYVDACEKLTRFNAKDVKPREIAQVVLHCCQQEANWNPYYSHLSEKLCSLDPRYKISFKFLLWEKFDDFSTATSSAESAASNSANNMNARALANWAKLYAHLIGGQSMSPTVLKAFPFEQSTAKGIVFLRMLLITLFLEFDAMTVLKMFVQAATSKDFAELAQNFDIFIQTNMKTLKPEVVKHCRLGRPPYKVSDAASTEHVRSVCVSLRKALSQVIID